MTVINDTKQILTVVQHIAAEVTALKDEMAELKQTVGQIDARLISVEQDTKLIPFIFSAVSENSADLDNHERRIRRLEPRTAH